MAQQWPDEIAYRDLDAAATTTFRQWASEPACARKSVARGAGTPPAWRGATTSIRSYFVWIATVAAAPLFDAVDGVAYMA